VVEFHHFCSHYTLEDTLKCIEKMKYLGYKNYIEKPDNNFKFSEITFTI